MFIAAKPATARQRSRKLGFAPPRSSSAARASNGWAPIADPLQRARSTSRRIERRRAVQATVEPAVGEVHAARDDARAVACSAALDLADAGAAVRCRRPRGPCSARAVRRARCDEGGTDRAARGHRRRLTAAADAAASSGTARSPSRVDARSTRSHWPRRGVGRRRVNRPAPAGCMRRSCDRGAASAGCASRAATSRPVTGAPARIAHSTVTLGVAVAARARAAPSTCQSQRVLRARGRRARRLKARPAL